VKCGIKTHAGFLANKNKITCDKNKNSKYFTSEKYFTAQF